MKTDPTVSARSASADRPAAKPFTRHLPTAARILLGLGFLVFGLNGFLNFIPPPSKPMPEEAGAFLGALLQSGYMFPLVAGTQALVGLLLLVNRFVPLALVLIAPIIVNIVAFHLFLEPSGTVVALVVMALESYLLWSYRKNYYPMLASRAIPA